MNTTNQISDNINFVFDEAKAISSMLYICNTLGGSWDKYSLLKILYFAEQRHLVTYGRPITGDSIVALKYGPVPSNSYNVIDASKVNSEYFELQDTVVIPKAIMNLDCLSESDIECLNFSIEENKHLDFGRLKNKSHDSAYNYTVTQFGINAKISFLDIAKSAGADEHMLDYIKSISENQACEFHAAT
jgi:uncharacterized phage-associated protein